MDYADYLQNRIYELAKAAYDTGTYRFSKFHGLRSMETCYRMKDKISFIKTSVYEAYPNSERKIIIFGDKEDFEYDPDIPVSILKIEPAFAHQQIKLHHRDYLGAILGLGIDKSFTGDIVVDEESAYIAMYKPSDKTIMDELSYVGRNAVKVSLVDKIPENISRTKQIDVSIASLRLDAILSAVLNLSRSASSALILKEKVFVNGIGVTEPAKLIKDADRIVVRGYGLLVFDFVSGVSRKGRNFVHITIYL